MHKELEATNNKEQLSIVTQETLSFLTGKGFTLFWRQYNIFFLEFEKKTLFKSKWTLSVVFEDTNNDTRHLERRRYIKCRRASEFTCIMPSEIFDGD